MEKNFDPYLQWLGIRDPERPPNHYRLLGLDLFEADKNVIAGAADRQMAHVRTFQGGKYSEESQRLLNEISAAKLCLMREGRKAKYDDELREQNGVGAAPAMPAAKPAVKAPATSAAGTTAGPIQVDAPSPSSLVVGKKSNGGFPWMWVAAGVGLLVVVGLIIGLAAKQAAQSGTPVANNGGANENIGTAENGGSSNAETENDENDPPTGNGGNDQEDGGITAQPGDGDNGDNGNGENGTGNGADGHETNSAVDEPGDGTPAPWDVARVAEKITGLEAPKVTVSKSVLEPLRIAREAMKNRDLAAVDSHLSDALAQAKSASEIGEVQRLSALNDWLSNFWDAVQSAATSLSPGDYFAFSGQEVAVVASSPNSITLRAKGGQKKTFSTDPAAIDAELAIALARHYLNGSSPQAAVGVAAFEALDRDGNHPTAVLLVQEASSQAIPVEPLETELTHDYKLLSMAGTGPASASTNGESGGPTAEPTDNRQDVPSGEPYEKAVTLVRELYEKELSNADRDRKIEVAQKMIQQGRQTDSRPAAQFVLFNTARRVAASAASGDVAMEAIDEIAQRFKVEDFEVRKETLDDMIRPAVRMDEAVPLVDLAFELAGDAAADEQFREAEGLLSDVLRGIRGTRDAALMRRVNERKDQIEEMRRQYFAAESAREKLAEDPNDENAHLALGRYLCFQKEAWDEGLPHLENSNDRTLAPLAKLELAEGKSPRQQFKLAGTWFEAAEDEPRTSDWKIAYLDRSARWYEMTLPALSGIEKDLAEKRLKEIARARVVQENPGSRDEVVAGNVALASAGTVVKGDGINNPEFLNDGITRSPKIDGTTNGALRNPWEIVFPKVYRIQQLRFFLWWKEKATRRFAQYQIFGSLDGENYQLLVDKSQGKWQGLQVLDIQPTRLKSLRIVPLYWGSIDGEATLRFFAVELEAYCVAPR